MPEVLERITDALDDSTSPREDLIALGIAVAGVILTLRQEQRAQVVDTFCAILRKSITSDMH